MVHNYYLNDKSQMISPIIFNALEKRFQRLLHSIARNLSFMMRKYDDDHNDGIMKYQCIIFTCSAESGSIFFLGTKSGSILISSIN
ncbi:hypothetical protein MtrunA17_Chr7g0247851 [Medicago truncatula]|uniref:Uncharacterized protein n=1 Tax=Medicago truncatula TaxID=3880 RepID=Q2HTK7_MEDTR|nr:hypothetical protein MtrDRAFT_AC150440g4v2 [Medicago truncatula]RHN46964.1 hypothetical protein MtrunA17_Chr7g0247851 [Medicago truncatula]